MLLMHLKLKMIQYGMQVYFKSSTIFKNFVGFFIHFLAALEARVAASYVSSQKPKRQIQRTLSFLKQNSLHRSRLFFFFPI
jgi:hypothetical protein